MPCCKTRSSSPCYFASTTSSRRNAVPTAVDAVAIFTELTTLASRGCPPNMRGDCSSRLSFCCAVCRKRSTSLSVRFLGRRVYLGLAVVLTSASRTGFGSTPTSVRVAAELGVARQTLQRWQSWWREQFPLTPLWRAACARFMPPVPEELLPGELLVRFTGEAPEVLMRLLTWLSPLTVSRKQPTAIELAEGR